MASQTGRGAETPSTDATGKLAVLHFDVAEEVLVVSEGGLALWAGPL